MSGYLDSPRYRAALHDFLAAAEQDTNLVDQAQATADVLYTSDETRAKAQKEGKVPYSLLYHSVLHGLVTELAPRASEALSLASYCQHIRRWEIPRATFPEGLAGYKAWRFNLNKYHTKIAHEIMRQSGYDDADQEDQKVFAGVENLLMKKTLKGGDDDRGDEEMQAFEDAICLTFLILEFREFSLKHDVDKMVKIVQKTWAKMGKRGREYTLEHLVNDNSAIKLDEASRDLLGRALAG